MKTLYLCLIHLRLSMNFV